MGIGPSTKETSLHHFRDPLLDVVSKDTDVDLMGVMLVGSPDGNEDKMLVGTRAAVWAECMRADGVILSCDGWGHSDCAGRMRRPCACARRLHGFQHPTRH